MAKVTDLAFGATSLQIATDKDRVMTRIQSVGVGVKPNPPRSVTPQSGARKIVLTWVAPDQDIAGGGYRVYKDTEINLYKDIQDPSCRQVEVNASSGATPNKINVFVSRVDPSGVESRKVWVQCAPTAEAGAPADPSPPPDWDQEPHGGCVEVGTPCEDPDGTTIERVPNSDWVVLDMGDRPPVWMHPSTLVSVWKRASELTVVDRIDSDANGGWRSPKGLSYVRKDSEKEMRRCPGGVYRARGLRLHNKRKEGE